MVGEVVAQRFKIERPLVPERVVQALSADAHPAEQVVCRRALEADIAENLYGAFQGHITIEFLGPRHGNEANLSEPGSDLGEIVFDWKGVAARPQCFARLFNYWP